MQDLQVEDKSKEIDELPEQDDVEGLDDDDENGDDDDDDDDGPDSTDAKKSVAKTVPPKPTGAEGTGTAAAKGGRGLVLAKTKPLVMMPVGKKVASPKPKASPVDENTSSSDESEFAQSMRDLVKDMDKRKASCKGGKKATKTKKVKKDTKPKKDKGKKSKK